MGSEAPAFGDHLHVLANAAAGCLELAVGTHSAGLGQVHQLDLDLLSWVNRIQGPERDQLQGARRELALAEYSAASGLYRQAYSGLRLFLELSVAAVYFSANEFHRRQWLSDRSDFSWAKALDSNVGVLSASFVQEFAPAAVADAPSFANTAGACYRECSQFVHGKAVKSRLLPYGIEYQATVLTDWCQQAKAAAEAVLYLLYARYGNDLDLRTDSVLQEIMIARFAHLKSVREVLDLARD